MRRYSKEFVEACECTLRRLENAAPEETLPGSQESLSAHPWTGLLKQSWRLKIARSPTKSRNPQDAENQGNKQILSMLSSQAPPASMNSAANVK
jgi:hypothetical protein